MKKERKRLSYLYILEKNQTTPHSVHLLFLLLFLLLLLLSLFDY